MQFQYEILPSCCAHVTVSFIYTSNNTSAKKQVDKLQSRNIWYEINLQNTNTGISRLLVQHNTYLILSHLSLGVGLKDGVDFFLPCYQFWASIAANSSSCLHLYVGLSLLFWLLILLYSFSLWSCSSDILHIPTNQFVFLVMSVSLVLLLVASNMFCF